MNQFQDSFGKKSEPFWSCKSPKLPLIFIKLQNFFPLAQNQIYYYNTVYENHSIKVSFCSVFVAGKKWDFFGNFSNSVCNSEKFLLYLNYIAWCDLYLCREIRMKVFSSAFSCVCVAQKREHQWGRGEERKSSCMMDALFDIINWITHTLLSFEVTFINCEKWTSHLKIFHVLLFL